tara:strand:- start:148 stop:903 length:756 start_codon:yes stop_codon:yes gene_type:complete
MLYVFGDSYSVDVKDLELSNETRRKVGKYPDFLALEDNWVNIVSKKIIGSVDCVNEALSGTSNEHILHKVLQYSSNFVPGDHIIIQLTSQQRRWLFKNKPELSNWAQQDLLSDSSLSSAEKSALKSYGKHLNHDLSDNAIYMACLYATTYIGKMLGDNGGNEDEGIKVLILPGFHNVAGVEGHLSNVCFGEFDNEDTCAEFYKKTSDNRWNHMSQVNHTILADKVLDFFEDYTFIDLSTDFQKDIYTKDNI